MTVVPQINAYGHSRMKSTQETENYVGFHIINHSYIFLAGLKLPWYIWECTFHHETRGNTQVLWALYTLQP